MDFRFIHSDNGTLDDHSTEINNYHSGTSTVNVVAADDYLFIGSLFPFNSFYLKVGTANDQASVMSIDYWNGRSWQDVVETRDETASSGVSLAQDGRITFVPDKNESWICDDTVYSSGGELITGLGNATIYDLYWIRISFSGDLNASTALSWMGHLFSSDDQLYTEYPLFNNSNLKASFESGKTTWEEQAVKASQKVIEDLISKGVLSNGNQILDYKKLSTANVQRTASVIFGGMGDSYRDDVQASMIEYNRAISKGNFYVDRNNNARIDRKEAMFKGGGLYR